MVKIEDNYLDKDYFKSLEQVFFGNHFQWYYQDTVAFKAEDKNIDNFYFVHQFYKYPRILSDRFDLLEPLLNKLRAKALVNIKINMYPKTEQIFKHNLHKDQNYDVKSALLYLNTCDGYTYFKEEDKKVASVANRIAHFNSGKEHHSTTTSDQRVRITLNINYF
jgi:hypothetical protein